MVLQKGEKKIIADANSIDDYAIRLQPLYDFNKKKIVFTWVPDTSVYWDFENVLIQMITREYNLPITSKTIKSMNFEKIYNSIFDWIETIESNTYNNTRFPAIFYKVFLINEMNGKLTSTTYDKESITLEQIRNLSSVSTTLENSLALSFFYLNKKFTSKINDFEDILIGIILYDLKNKETLCFNLQSLTAFSQEFSSPVEFKLLYDIVLELLKRSLDSSGDFRSFLPLPIDSPWYTPLPWICFSVLRPIDIRATKVDLDIRRISIPEFFTFGYSSFITDRSSTFAMVPFSSQQKGHAACVLKLNDNGNRLTYNVRFDKSAGEPLVHLDYAMWDGKKESKLISHYPLDLEQVYAFNPDMLVAILSAGIFDGYFTTIIQKGLKGIEELLNRNPAFLYPLTMIWKVETSIAWLNENKEGYDILQKLSTGQGLNDNEKAFVRKMSESHINLVATEGHTGEHGLNYIGYFVLERFRRGYSHIAMDRLPHRPSISPNKKQAIAKFEGWLKEENYPLLAKETDNADYFATVNTVPKFYIVIQKNKIDRIDLGTDINLISQGQNIMSSIEEKNRSSLIFNLQAELLHMHLICAFRPSFDKADKIEIRTYIYFDGLTKDKFFDKILEIMRAYALVSTRVDAAKQL